MPKGATMPGRESAPTPRHDDEDTDDRHTTRRRRIPRRGAIVALATLVALGALCGAAFIPKVANHFGYALSGERGLPYQVDYNGRDYRNNLTCAGAQWCEDEKTPEQRSKPYCTPRAGLALGEGDGRELVKVDDIFTMLGSSHPVFTAGVLPQGETATKVIVEASNDCYLAYDLVGGP